MKKSSQKGKQETEKAPKTDTQEEGSEEGTIDIIDPNAEEELQRLTDSCLELDSKIKRLQKRNILFFLFPIVMLIRVIFKALDHHYQEQWILEL